MGIHPYILQYNNVLVLFDNYHIVLNCTVHVVHSSLNSFILHTLHIGF